MTVGTFLHQATSALEETGIATARLDSLILLEDVVGKDRSVLLAHDELALTEEQLQSLNNSIAQRKKHVPLAYIRGKVLFYGRDFFVDRQVLIPRPETECIIDLLRTLPLPAQARIADIGCGSGCIGITAALELPQAEVYLSDISQEALHIARKNARLLSAVVHIQRRDLLQQAPRNLHVLLANLPYVPIAHPINQAASFEPRIALFSGVDGLDHYRTFWHQVKDLPELPRYIICETFPNQHSTMQDLALRGSYRLEQTSGFVQQFVEL